MIKFKSYTIIFSVNFFCFLSSLSASPPNKEVGIVAYWDFNEGSGEIVKDKSGNGNDGRIYGAKWVKIKNGFALKFDGIDDYINCGNNPRLSFNESAFSIELCIKPNDLRKDVSILAKGGVREYAIRVGGGYIDKVIIFVTGWDHYRYSGSNAVQKGCWTHIVYVKKDTNLDCYIDGKLSNGSVTAIPLSVSGSDSLVIGGMAGYGYFNGVLDEVKIYNRALIAEEIKTKYEQVSVSTRWKYIIKSIKKLLKVCLVVLMIIFIVLMRIFWAKDVINSSC